MVVRRKASDTAQPLMRFAGAVAVSIAMIAPTMAVALNGVGAAQTVGRAVPIAFLLATVGVGLVGYAFVALSRLVHHAGSAYAFTGITLGPRAGFISGWALLGAYLMYAAGVLGAFGFLIGRLVQQWGGETPWWAAALCAAVVSFLIVRRRVGHVARVLLGAEALSVGLIIVLIGAVFVRLATGTAPAGLSINAEPFSLPPHVSAHQVALASVFGFLSFAGFEGAAALGEETADPRRNIGRAIRWSVLIAGALFVVAMTAQILGFGADEAGVAAFIRSGSPLNVLADRYLGSPMGDILIAGAVVSAFGCASAMITAASRLLFAFCREGLGPAPLARWSAGGVPGPALTATTAAACVAVGCYAAADVSGEDMYFALGAMGTLCLLVSYALVNAGALRWLWAGGPRTPRAALGVLPIAALCVVGFALLSSVWPVAGSPEFFVPCAAAAWLAFGLIAVVLRPGQVTASGVRLLRRQQPIRAWQDTGGPTGQPPNRQGEGSEE
ncbi:APC family permease [Streptomyces sp. NPDC019396]|uniref:APC family permease n=1 Tax=Streptomyces sp. NPDC019396 TaxID=3154687 RepID=UPI00340ADBED